jgi:hypothetical protein
MTTRSFDLSIAYAAAAAVLGAFWFEARFTVPLGFYLEGAFLWLTVVAYTWGVLRSGRGALVLAALGGAWYFLLYWLAASPHLESVGAAVALAAVRQFRFGASRGAQRRVGRAHRVALRRSLGIEALGVAAALLAAYWLYDGSRFGFALAVWGFWLVQAGMALVLQPAVELTRPKGDAFDRAHERARELLEEIRERELSMKTS